MVIPRILANYNNLLCYFGDKEDPVNLKKLDISQRDIISAEQIHSNNVIILKDHRKKFIKGADGMVTNKKVILSIRSADCLPIFFFDPKKKIVAAIHAGWKGLYKGIINNAINLTIQLGSSPKDIKVAIGPHIGICCYNVPEGRIKKFQANGHFCELRSNVRHLNLGKIALFQLKSLGVKDTNIEISNVCTSCDRNYWSYRRDGEKAGRMINIIGIDA